MKPETVQGTAVVYPTGVLGTGVPATSTLPGSHGPESGHGQGSVPGNPTGVTPGGPGGEPVAILPPAPEPQPYPGAPEQTRPTGSPPPYPGVPEQTRPTENPPPYPGAPEPTRPAGSPSQSEPGAPYPSPHTTTGQHTGAPFPSNTTGGPPPTYTSGASDMTGPSSHGTIIGLFVCAVMALMG